ncbi:hypothetical protein COCC4DRAFT_33988, partial [Bipolaris maydis ATCC 48331]
MLLRPEKFVEPAVRAPMFILLLQATTSAFRSSVPSTTKTTPWWNYSGWLAVPADIFWFRSAISGMLGDGKASNSGEALVGKIRSLDAAMF